MYQRTGDSPELLELLARYLDGQVPLEAAANQWTQIYTALTQRPFLGVSSQSEFTAGDRLPPFKEADLPKIYALLERVQAKLDVFIWKRFMNQLESISIQPATPSSIKRSAF